jgi:probable F420-dependent oxidoreductase
MRYSVTIVPTDQSIRIADFARAVEERGFDGLWVPDHTHVPTSRASPYPLGGDLPERYKRNLEPLVALGMAAAVTSMIRLGTGVLLPALRDPIVMAKALATLDQQSGGRVVAGVGFGWNLEEIADHGVDPAARRGRMREHILAMRALWEREVASFEGRHVSFPESWSWPKPTQSPLPVLIGGAPTRLVFEHVVDYAQGWVAMGGHGLAEAVARLRGRAAAAGRDPDGLQIVSFTSAQLSHPKIDALERAGATEIAFEVPSRTSAHVLACLDRMAEFVRARRSAIGDRLTVSVNQ